MAFGGNCVLEKRTNNNKYSKSDFVLVEVGKDEVEEVLAFYDQGEELSRSWP